jgi:formylmethanofuran dehydrogenase subunit C
MIWFRRLIVTVGVAAGLTVFAAPASAQVTYALAGVEIAATPTVGTFVGVALAPDDFGTWGAVIEHTPLADVALITEGTFAIDGQVRDLQGIILPGGNIVRLGGSCRKEAFAVTGNVALAGGGSGAFGVKLTHYGFGLPGGGCVTFFATVEGLITLALPPSP